MNEEIHNEALILIEDICLMLTNKRINAIRNDNAQSPSARNETQYDSEALRETVQRNVLLLNQQQKYAYDTLMKVVNDGTGGIFFLDFPGGTGKTFLISLILATILRWPK